MLHTVSVAPPAASDRELVRQSCQDMISGMAALRQKTSVFEKAVLTVLATRVKHATYKKLQTAFSHVALDYAATKEKLDGGYKPHLGKSCVYVGALDHSMDVLRQLQNFMESVRKRKTAKDLACDIKYIHKTSSLLHKQLAECASQHNVLYTDTAVLLGLVEEAHITLLKDAEGEKELAAACKQDLESLRLKKKNAGTHTEMGAGAAVAFGVVTAALTIVPPAAIALAVGGAVAALYAAGQRIREHDQEHKMKLKLEEAQDAEAREQQAVVAVTSLRQCLLPCMEAFCSAIKDIAAAFNNIASDTKRFANISSIKDLGSQDMQYFEFMHGQLCEIAGTVLECCKALLGGLPRLQAACNKLEEHLSTDLNTTTSATASNNIPSLVSTPSTSSTPTHNYHTPTSPTMPFDQHHHVSPATHTYPTYQYPAAHTQGPFYAYPYQSAAPPPSPSGYGQPLSPSGYSHGQPWYPHVQHCGYP